MRTSGYPDRPFEGRGRRKRGRVHTPSVADGIGKARDRGEVALGASPSPRGSPVTRYAIAGFAGSPGRWRTRGLAGMGHPLDGLG